MTPPPLVTVTMTLSDLKWMIRKMKFGFAFKDDPPEGLGQRLRYAYEALIAEPSVTLKAETVINGKVQEGSGSTAGVPT